MSLLRFVKGYAKAKSQSAGTSLIQTIVSWDPEGASEADILAMSEDLDKLVEEAAKASEEAEREQRRSDEIKDLYNKRLAGVEVLEARKEGASAEEAAQIDAVINEELTKLEEMLPEIEREEAKAKEALEYKKELDEMCQAAADKLKQARAQLTKARRDMERAKLREKRAEEKAKKAAILAGITKDVSRMSSALSTMTAEAEAANARAEAKNMKTRLLKTNNSSSDLMEEAMKEASRSSDTQKRSAAERLAALRKKV